MSSVLITVLLLLSAIAAFLTIGVGDFGQILEIIIGLPGAAALLTALWFLVQERVKQQHQIELSERQNAFALSATSHMAKVAFDKHVEFAEAYKDAVQETLVVFTREGPTKQALDLAGKMYDIRRKFVLWETQAVTKCLDKFEHSIRRIGAVEHHLDSIGAGELRTQLVEEVHRIFADVVGIREVPNDPTPEIATAFVIEQLRLLLGIEQLTQLRRHYIEVACNGAGASSKIPVGESPPNPPNRAK